MWHFKKLLTEQRLKYIIFTVDVQYTRDVVDLHSPVETNVDYDALYESNDADEEDVDMKSHGSVITHLLSQVRIGMDLTKIVLPTFILERRSLLEMYSDFFAHPDIFLEIADGKDPEQRMIRVLRWYLSSFHAGRKSSVAKKPYNPILVSILSCLQAFWQPILTIDKMFTNKMMRQNVQRWNVCRQNVHIWNKMSEDKIYRFNLLEEYIILYTVISICMILVFYHKKEPHGIVSQAVSPKVILSTILYSIVILLHLQTFHLYILSGDILLTVFHLQSVISFSLVFFMPPIEMVVCDIV